MEVDSVLFRYFGRAKELPGVKELFQSRKKEEEEENAVETFYKRFSNKDGDYYGDLNNDTENLEEIEMKEELENWEEMAKNVRETLGLPDDSPLPPFPLNSSTSSSSAKSKQKPPDPDAMQIDSSEPDPQKRAAKVLAAYLPLFTGSPEELYPPAIPNRDEMEAILLDLRKKMLVGEYFGDE